MNKIIVCTITAGLFLTGCADMSERQKGTAIGGGIGAGVGAALGKMTGDGSGSRTAKGAVIGGVAGAAIGNIWSKRMQDQKREMEKATQGTGIQVTQTSDNRLKLDIPSDISFDTNRADIKANFRPFLDKFAASLQENPVTTVNIVGHTDSTGNDATNNPLSIERAAHTRDYLVRQGIAADRFSVEGKGEREPVASNDTDSGRARNRRVEIYVAERSSN